MNRNVESHFSENPISLDIQRSIFDRSSGVKLTFNVGNCVPFLIDEILPGDSWRVTTSKVVRLQTMLTPIMDNIYLDTYYFFVPNRLIWNHWTNFMGESDSAWLPEVEYSVPQLVIGESGVELGSLMDYMGLPLQLPSGTSVNALPFRAYAKVMDDWFRDENLTDPLVFSVGDEDTTSNSISDDDIYCAAGGPLFGAARYHDYFSSCLPAPMAGTEGTVIPITNASSFDNPVYYKVDTDSSGESPVDFLRTHPETLIRKGNSWLDVYKGSEATDIFPGTDPHYKLTADSGSVLRPYDLSVFPASNPITSVSLNAQQNTSGKSQIFDSGLYSFVPEGIVNTLISINDLRTAFQIQRFYEKSARSGRRYIETLKAQFGVTSPDARLQRSEYLGGNRVPIQVHEVVNSSESETAFLGNLGATSATSDVNEDFTKSFTEHGYIIGICVARYDHTYGQGLERMWSRKSMFDFYWPVFASLGERAVFKKEIYFDPTEGSTANDAVFGYQEAWAEYRYKPSRVCAEMRPDAPNSLASWHLADDYDSPVSLSDSWIREDKTNVDRVLAVTSAVSNQIFADFYIQNICTRAMPMYSIPGLIDHH